MSITCPKCNHVFEDERRKKAGSKGGLKNKGKERPDLKKGGATWERRWGKKSQRVGSK